MPKMYNFSSLAYMRSSSIFKFNSNLRTLVKKHLTLLPHTISELFPVSNLVDVSLSSLFVAAELGLLGGR